MSTTTLTIYCVLVMAAALAGGLLPAFVRLSHSRMQVALSFVSGVMLGVALLHMLPHAWIEQVEAAEHAGDGAAPSLDVIALWIVAGFLVMFLLERFLCFHHHEMDACDGDHGRVGHQSPTGPSHTHAHEHDHTLSWAGAMVGLTVHSVLNGIALAAAVAAESHGESGLALAGFGTFLVIFLHKPFDSLTIGTLMAAGKRSMRARMIVNAAYSVCVPIGAATFVLGGDAISGGTGASHSMIAAALALSAGMFLCIALSDVLPELQFHQHDRVKLTAALLAGLALAYVIGVFEGGSHGHDHPTRDRDTSTDVNLIDADHDHDVE